MNRKKILIVTVLIMALCLLSVACGRNRTSDAEKEVAKTSSVEEDAKTKAEAEKKAAEEKAKKEAEEAAAQEEANQQNEQEEETATAASTDTKKEKSKSSSSSKKPKEKKKVWVEPVYETRTIKPDTGTRYCNGANSGGGCGASWNGTKDGTYNSWHKHWQDYVKKRTAEEAAEGRTYVCDHIHDDSRWVADPEYTEQVLVKEGYWKEVS